AARRIHLRAQVHRGAVLDARENVPETLREVDRAAVHGVEDEAVPAPESGGPDPEIDDIVDKDAAGRREIFSLRRRDVGVMDAAKHPGGRDRDVRLTYVHLVADLLGQVVDPEA